MTDLKRERGDTFPDRFAIKKESDGLPLDITGYSFLLTVDPEKYPIDNSNNLFQITGVIVDAANGIVEFAPSAVQADQTPNVYYYDAQLTDQSGRIRTFDRGKYKIIQDITKN